MHFDPKPISAESIPEALAKVERYRLLNEPSLAESICLDILAIVPRHQQALISLLLARTDQFGDEGMGERDGEGFSKARVTTSVPITEASSGNALDTPISTKAAQAAPQPPIMHCGKQWNISSGPRHSALPAMTIRFSAGTHVRESLCGIRRFARCRTRSSSRSQASS